MEPETTRDLENKNRCCCSHNRFFECEEETKNEYCDHCPYQTHQYLSRHPFCLTCHRICTCIPCKQCKLIFYCSENCRDQNQTHINECREFFQHISNETVKTVIQMLLEKISMFRNVQEFIKHIEASIQEKMSLKHDKKLSIGPNDKLSNLYHVMTIQSASYSDEFCEQAEMAYELITQIPIIQRSFNRKEKRVFLKPLIFYYLSVVQGEKDKTLLVSEGTVN